MLPGLSGYEVVRRLRAEDNWVPVLMLSAKDGEYDQADALDDGADDYLTKPFSFVVLLARLRALLRRGVVARPAVLQAGRAAPRSRQPAGVPRRGPVALTPREFVLLEYLMRHPGRAVGKEELLHPRLGRRRGHGPQRRRGLRGLPAPQARAPSGSPTVRGAGYRLVE